MFGYKPLPDLSRQKILERLPKIVDLFPSNFYAVPETVASICTLEDDLTHYRVGGKGLKINIKANAGGYRTTFVMSELLNLPPTATLGVWVWVEDASVLPSMRLTFYTNAERVAPVVQYDLNANGIVLANGWNLLRWNAFQSTVAFKQLPIYEMRLDGGATNTNPTSITIGHIWAECPPKAQVVLIDDGCYPEFYTQAYPDLRARNIPVVWATSPYKITSNPTTHMTEAQLIAASMENNNEINFHSYGEGITADMTDIELVDECKKAISWLRQRGYNGGRVRSAWLQNLAPQHVATRSMFFGYANPTGGEGAITSFPFVNKWLLRRFAIGIPSTDAYLNDIFDKLKYTHSLAIIYFHNYSETGDTNVNAERWGKFLSLVDTAISEGWLEFVTFNQLLDRSGVKTKPADGDWVRELYEEYGSYGYFIRG